MGSEDEHIHLNVYILYLKDTLEKCKFQATLHCLFVSVHVCICTCLCLYVCIQVCMCANVFHYKKLLVLCKQKITFWMVTCLSNTSIFSILGLSEKHIKFDQIALSVSMFLDLSEDRQLQRDKILYR